MGIGIDTFTRFFCYNYFVVGSSENKVFIRRKFSFNLLNLRRCAVFLISLINASDAVLLISLQIDGQIFFFFRKVNHATFFFLKIIVTASWCNFKNSKLWLKAEAKQVKLLFYSSLTRVTRVHF